MVSMLTPKPGDLVLWKQYGFRHIIRDDTKTLCGNDWKRHVGWWILLGKDTEYRPLCGVCRRINEHWRKTDKNWLQKEAK